MIAFYKRNGAGEEPWQGPLKKVTKKSALPPPLKKKAFFVQALGLASQNQKIKAQVQMWRGTLTSLIQTGEGFLFTFGSWATWLALAFLVLTLSSITTLGWHSLEHHVAFHQSSWPTFFGTSLSLQSELLANISPKAPLGLGLSLALLVAGFLDDCFLKERWRRRRAMVRAPEEGDEKKRAPPTTIKKMFFVRALGLASQNQKIKA